MSGVVGWVCIVVSAMVRRVPPIHKVRNSSRIFWAICTSETAAVAGLSVHDDHRKGRASRWRSINWTGALLELLAEEPRIGVLEASRRLGVARGTVQARLDRLQSNGVIRGFGPDVDPAALGYPVTAFATLEIKQGQGD